MTPDPLSPPGADARVAVLLEREGDLAVLGGLLADARAGEGRLAVIEGPAGIGKTRLLEEARAAADGLGRAVLHARGGELERDFGFGVVRQLLEPRVAGAGASERAELFAGAAGLAEAVIAPQSAAAPAAGDLSQAALHGLYWLVVNLTERSPLLVAVDDLQWVDGPSLRFLHYLVMRLDGVPVAIVATLRSGEASPEPELLDGLMLEAEVLRPAALSRAAVASIVRGRLGDDAPAELCDACHESSRGNPYLLGELLRELGHDRGAASELDPAAVRRLGPRRIAKSVLLRVGRLGPDARALARALAVLGEADELSQVAVLAGLEPAAAGALADALTELGVLSPGRPVRFAHPVVRTAIYQDTPASERASMQRRAAELLAGDPEQAAVHLLAADPHGDPQAVVMLRAGARAAQARGAPDSAVRYLRRALAEPPAPAVRTELLAEVGLAQHLLGEADATELLLEAFELTETQPARATIGLALVHELLDSRPAQGERAVAVFERALEGLEDPMLRSMIEALILVSGPSPRAARPLVAQRLREARARVEQVPDHQARPLLVPLALQAAMTDTAAATIRLAQRALGDGDLIRLAAVAGRLAAAEADARLWLEEPAMAAWPIPSAVATAALVFVLVERGRLGEARRTLDAFERFPHDPEAVPSQPLRSARAYLLAAEGKPATALQALRECERFERDWQARSGVCPVAWRCQAALCHQALGHHSEARRLADDELTLARRFGAPPRDRSRASRPRPRPRRQSANAHRSHRHARRQRCAPRTRPRRDRPRERHPQDRQARRRPRDACRGRRSRPPLWRHQTGRPRARRAAARGRPPAPHRTDRPRRAHARRAPRRRARRPRRQQQTDRAGPVRHPAHRRDAPLQQLPETRHRKPRATHGRTARPLSSHLGGRDARTGAAPARSVCLARSPTQTHPSIRRPQPGACQARWDASWSYLVSDVL